VSVDTPGLGSGATDSALIAWSAANKHVFVTKDWKTSHEPYITKQLKDLGVSAVWIRHERKSNLALLDLLYVAVRDLRKIAPAVEASGEPVYYECRLGVSARLIQVPTRRPKRSTRRKAT